MKYMSKEEFLSHDKLERIRILKLIAAGAVRIKEDNNMSKTNIIEPRIKEILEFYPETRENDNLLYVKYIKEYHYVDFNENVFVNYEEYGLPSFKTIERVRRDIQNAQNMYKASEKVEEERKEAEKQYINNYAN